MGGRYKLFSIEEINALDASQLDELRDAVVREIEKSPEIRELLRAKVRRTYDKLKGKGRRK
ncbi:MAG TPA: hypothetical protein VF865_17485 [Acidobacteriaceae bacterium]